MASPGLPLSGIVNVVVVVSPQAPAAPTFNQGLIVGQSTVIPSFGANSRTRKYTTLAQMIADGFTTSSPEYIAAQIYFGQLIPPQTLWVGRQDLTVIATFQPHAAAQGSGYIVGDQVGVVQGGASGGLLQVSAVGGSGNVTALTLVTAGTGYAVANGLATTGGTGTGLQVDILTVGESALVAFTACRASSSSWWAGMVIGAAKADNEALAAFAQSMTPVGCYFYSSADADALAGTTGNVFQFLNAAGYNRAYGRYATTQSGLAPNNTYSAAAAMGVAMGMNTGLANSFFTMKFKQLVGIVPETELTPTQIGGPGAGGMEGVGANISLTYVGPYTIEEQGTVADLQFLDEILNLDMIAADLQFSVMNALVAVPSIPQTDAGQTTLLDVVSQVAERARVRGFIAAGVWKGPQILNLTPNTPLPLGYFVQSDRYANQSSADHAARKAMPIYLSLKEAGAAHFVTIQVTVNR